MGSPVTLPAVANCGRPCGSPLQQHLWRWLRGECTGLARVSAAVHAVPFGYGRCGLRRPPAPLQSPRQDPEQATKALWKQWKIKYKRSYNATVVRSSRPL